MSRLSCITLAFAPKQALESRLPRIDGLHWGSPSCDNNKIVFFLFVCSGRVVDFTDIEAPSFVDDTLSPSVRVRQLS